MPARLSDLPERIRPYAFHGVQFNRVDDQSISNCPWCGKENKFYVAAATGMWDCKVCGKKGNTITFLKLLWEESDKITSTYGQLGRERGLLFPDETPLHWGTVKSFLTNDWLIPGYNHEGTLVQLYKYAAKVLYATPEMPHGLFGLPLYDPKKSKLYLCEGPWDGMALWETLRQAKAKVVPGNETNGEYVQTASEKASLLAESNVIAVPGCNVFYENWGKLAEGKNLILLFDNDYPGMNPQTKQPIPPAGYEGMKRACQVLAKAEKHPNEVSYLSWGREGYDRDLPKGYDVRDLLKVGTNLAERINQLPILFKKVIPIPGDWVSPKKNTTAKGKVDLNCLACSDWKTLVSSWKKATKFVEGLDKALAVMLAAAASTELVGDQLWIKIVGPASCGKSTLCEAISVAKDYVLAKSTIRGFHSGYQMEGSDEDNSLIAIVKGKTLVTKDGDTLLQSPNLPQILAEARDLYDRVSRSHYRNKASRDYEGVSMTWLLCGTSSLRSLDNSELGERFLDCVIIDEIDEDSEDEISWRVANRANRETNYLANGDPLLRENPEMVKAKQLTGGYLTYLRQNAQQLLIQVDASEQALRQCMDFAKFVAFMRARPSERQQEKVEREMSFRLTSQLVRLAKCLAIVLGRNTLDEQVMKRVKEVALDTARGRTLAIIKHLASKGEEGCDVGEIALRTLQSEDEERRYLKFLRGIKAVEMFVPSQSLTPKSKLAAKLVVQGSRRQHWKLSPRMAKLYARIFETEKE